MITLKALKLEDVVTYKGVTNIPLDKYPLVVVRGNNQDRQTKGSSNAAGKSLSYGVGLMTPLYFSPPASVRKKSAADTLNAKTSKIELELTNNNNDYKVAVSTKGKTFGLAVTRDGEPLKIRKVADLQSYIRRIFPLSEDQFNSTVLINGRAPSLLQTGKPETRFDFFESVFNLALYDQLYAKVSKKYNEIKRDVQTLDFVTAKRSELGELQDVTALNARMNKLNRNIELVQDRIRSYLEELQHVSTYITIAKDAENPELSTKEIKRQLKMIDDFCIKTQERYKKAAKYADSFKLANTVKAKLDEVDAQLAACVVPERVDPKLEAKIATYNKKIAAIDVQLNNNLDIEVKLEEIDNELKELGFTEKAATCAKKKSKDQWNTLAQTLSVTLREKREQLAPLQEIVGKKTCPCCQQVISGKYLQTLITSLEAEIPQLSDKVKRYRKYARYMEVYEPSLELKLLPNKKELFEEADRLALKRYKLEQTAFNIKEVARLKELRAQTAKLMPELPVDMKDDPEHLLELLETAKHPIAYLNSFLVAREKLKKLPKTYPSLSEARKIKKKYARFIDEYTPKLKKAQSSFNNLTALKANAENLNEQITAAEAEIKTLKKSTKDFEIYAALREAYSARGIRILQVRHLAETYCANLNKYAGLIYSEPMHFAVEVDKGIFNIVATRNKITSDVRKFSGSESSAFTLLSLVSLLPLIPSSLRTNLLVLDEIESGLDDPSLTLFTNELLPQLNKIVKNIVIITPRSDKAMPVPNAVTFNITKKGGVSSLKVVG